MEWQGLLILILLEAVWIGLLTWKAWVWRGALIRLMEEHRQVVELVTEPPRVDVDDHGRIRSILSPAPVKREDWWIKEGAYPVDDAQDAKMEQALRKVRRDLEGMGH